MTRRDVPESPVFAGQPFTRSMARDAGFSARRINRLLDDGILCRILNGVYIDARQPMDLLRRAHAVGLVLPAGAAVSRLTAAWLWGVDARDPDQYRQEQVLECTVPPGCEPRARPGIRSHVAPLDDVDITTVHGVRCTTAIRTAVDLLRWTPPHMGLAVADALAHAGLLTGADVQHDVERWAGRPGVAKARRLSACIEPATESFGESWLRLRLLDAGFPRPEAQIDIRSSSDRLIYRLDLGWPDRRVAVEYDGEAHHSARSDLIHDRHRREVLLRDHGWEVLGVGRNEVLGRSLRLEYGIGELLGMTPELSRRTW